MQHLTGVMARVWAAYPYCKADVVRAAFELTAKDLGIPGKDPVYGFGLIQAEAAFDYLARQPCSRGWRFASNKDTPQNGTSPATGPARGAGEVKSDEDKDD